MKSSSVVLGFKLWTSKLHPQLPLDKKESQKLLTALTSSFRQQLDEAHPWPQDNGGDAALKTASRLASGSDQRPLQPSSAHLADTHLASVLSSPFMSKFEVSQNPKASSNIEESTRDLTSDPILSLERSRDHGAAALSAARHCLRKFKKSIGHFSVDQREVKILQIQAGTRALRWLRSKQLLQSDDICRDSRLLKIMVWFLEREGRDDLVWNWMAFDRETHHYTQSHLDRIDQTPVSQVPSEIGILQGLLLKWLIYAKLFPEVAHTESTNITLDTFFKACEVSQASPWKDTQSPNLTFAGRAISRILRIKPSSLPAVDEQRHDRFIAAVPLWTEGRNPIRDRYVQSDLWLYHPTRPIPYPALHVMEDLFGNERTPDAEEVHLDFEAPEVARVKRGQFDFFLRTAQLLHAQRDSDRASWVIRKAAQYFPDTAKRTNLMALDLGSTSTPSTTPSTNNESYHSDILSPGFG